MYSVLGNHKTMTHRYTVNVIHIYRGIIVFTQHNCKQNLHYSRNSDLKHCAVWHLKVNDNAVDIILLYNISQKIIGFILNILQRY